MLVDCLVKKCNERYVCRCNDGCATCSYGANCPRNCEQCLEFVHYPDRAPQNRTYDCTHMADYYYCKYTYRYSSEMMYALKMCDDIKELDELTVMSIGCGPCTDLAAIDCLHESNVLKFSKLNYFGCDYAQNVWGNIWNDISNVYGESVHFNTDDVLSKIGGYKGLGIKPDVIVLQYVLSDMIKNDRRDELEVFIDRFIKFVNAIKDKSVYIVINDINLNKRGRDNFGDFFEKLAGPKEFSGFHFVNDKGNYYQYGTQHTSNELLINVPQDILSRYNPYMSCGSAQAVIKKEVI